MQRIEIKDLEKREDLDREAMAKVAGGRRRRRRRNPNRMSYIPLLPRFRR